MHSSVPRLSTISPPLKAHEGRQPFWLSIVGMESSKSKERSIDCRPLPFPVTGMMWTISFDGSKFKADNGFSSSFENYLNSTDKMIEKVQRVIWELCFNSIPASTVFEALMADIEPKNRFQREDADRALKWLVGQGKITLNLTRMKEIWAERYNAEMRSALEKPLRIQGSAATLLINVHDESAKVKNKKMTLNRALTLLETKAASDAETVTCEQFVEAVQDGVVSSLEGDDSGEIKASNSRVLTGLVL